MIRQLVKLGAVFTKEPTVYIERAKVSGCMWRGSAQMRLGDRDIEFTFELWHHGADKETVDSLLSHFSLHGLRVGEKFYDSGWYTILATDCIWLHKTGWFGFEPEKRSLAENELVRRRGNPNFFRPTYTKDEEKRLKKLGFVKLVEFVK